MTEIKTIIVDDEPHARRYLADLLTQYDGIDIMAQLKNGREALDYISSNPVDLIFLDIHMPGINGLEVMSKLDQDQTPIVIFTTAYDQYTIAAFEASALDYLLKPFDNHRLKKSIAKAKEQLVLKQHSAIHQRIAQLYQDLNDRKSPSRTEFIIKEKGFEKEVKSRDILWIESNSVYAELHTEKRKYLYRVALSLLEQQLPSEFLRIHRSIMINTRHFETVSYLNNNTYKFTMRNGAELLSSRSYKQAIMEKLSE